MRNKLLFLPAAGLSLMLGACSTSNKVVTNTTRNDDVYYSKATAIEQPATVAAAPRKEPADTDNNYLQGYYDGSYAGRLNRFYHGGTWRSYYNSPYYNYRYNPGFNLSLGFGSPYFYDPFYSAYGYGYGLYDYYSPGYFYNPYYYGGLFGSGYAYNNYFPGYGNYGYYSPGNSVIPDNSRTRPNREGLTGNSGIYSGGVSGGSSSTGRPQRSGYAPAASGDRVSSVPTQSQGSQPASRPSRTSSTNPSTSNQPSAPASRPERVSQPSYQPAPSPGPAPASSGSPAPSSSGRSSGGSRPSR
jgi:hypothetical protein